MGRKSVLIVEDDGILAAHLEDLLQRMEYATFGPVATGEQALELQGREHPDVVLMDIELAGSIDGVETARRISALGGPPVIYLSGYSQNPLLESAKQTGPYGYLIKPVSERELAAAIEIALYRHKLDREARASRDAAQRSEAGFRALFNSMAEGVLLVELVRDVEGTPVDYRVLAANPALVKQSGVPAETCIGRLASEVLADGRPLYLDEVVRVVETGEPLVASAYVPVLGRYVSGSVVCPGPETAAIVFLDVSERKREELALEQERRKYRTVFDASGDGIFVRAFDGRLLDVNRAMCERLGYSREELLALPLEAMYSREDAEHYRYDVARVARGEIVVKELEQVARSGRRIPIEVVARVIEYDGEPAVLSMVRDVSERKQAEAEVREHREFLQRVLDSLPDRVAVLNEAGVIVAVNGPWREFAIERGGGDYARVGPGVSYLEVCERAVAFEPEGSAASALEGIRGVLSGRLPRWSQEYPCHSPEQRNWFSMTVTPLMGKTKGAVVVHVSITERKLAEATLREKTEELDRYCETAQDLFCITSNRRFRWLNRQWSRTLGYPIEELQGKPYADYLHPEDQAASLVQSERLARNEEVHAFTNRYRCRDGSYRWLEWRCIPQGELVFASARDVTDRKLVEEALARSQAELQAIYENAPVMMCLLDEQMQVVYANRAFLDYEIPGRCRGQILGCMHRHDDESVCEFRTPDGMCPLRRALLDCLRQRISVAGLECRVGDTADGPVLLAAAAPIEAGDQVRALLCLSDITERKRAEDLVRQSEERYRSLIEHLPDGVIVNAEGRILYMNQEAARLLGCQDREAVVGLPLDLFVHPDCIPLVLARRQALESGAPAVPAVDFKFVRADGGVIEAEVVAVAVQYQGRLAIHSVLRDISERKRLEQKLSEMEKMESIGRLAGGVAHDFNNLLTVINGYSQMLLSRLHREDPMRGQVEEIYQAGARAEALTRQLLAFGRRQVLQPRRLELSGLVRGMESLLRRLASESIRFELSLADEPIWVHADPHQLEQVILNLAINARDATAAGGIISICTKAGVPGPGDRPCGMISVRDTGVGMDEQTRRHIFEPFFTTKGPAKGTGLGLSVVQGVVEQSGGWIDVASAPGEGATFSVYLPLSAPAREEPEAAREAGRTEGSETVLLVEDRREVRDYTAAALRFFGYRVIAAETAAQALELCETGLRVDLVLTDVVMPEMGGPELAVRLRRMRPGLPVLFMSGHAEAELARHGLDPAGAPLIEKPFTPPEIARRVRALLDGRSA